MKNEPIDIKSIFAEAIDIENAEERAAYLNKACGIDTELRAEVEALLKAHQEVGNFLEAPACKLDAVLETQAVIEGPGTTIGRYKLLELVGEGGMGLVYLAEQKTPVKRRVAFKIVKPGMDSKQVVARFEAERQALALLDHPNIAQVFDAGTTETGRPYFAMEYVKGLPITRYCDEKKLTIEQRLRLFEQVCEAVHHAHQKGIIHRDIKPSNILVSIHGDRAVPKIIDFGIAKAIAQPLTDKTCVTLQGQLLGTLEYMSPEQVDLATQDIDTRSDIYSLGIVLYELLAGVLPFESESFAQAGLAEIQRTIREQEPASPSIRLTGLGEKGKTIAASRGTQVVPLARRLHRELEWIPLKAMRKDRCRRYRSASEMADDVRNYLNGAPLIAGPETAMYRVQKFVRRHAGSVTTVALIAAAIILGLVVSTAMYFRAESMRVQAEQAKEKESIARTAAEQAEEATKQKAEELRRTLYANSIQLADAKYREGNIKRVRELLNACPNDLRGWEWNRLNYISDQSLMTLRGHEDFVTSVAVNPDGKSIASSSADGTIKVWDALTGIQLMTLHGHKSLVRTVAYSSDGKSIVSGGVGGIVKLWDATTGEQLMHFDAHKGEVMCVTFSPDSRRIASGGLDNKVKIWDAATGAEIMKVDAHERGVNHVVFTSDGKHIVSAGGEGKIKIWDVATGAEIRTIIDLEGWPIGLIALNPVGNYMLCVSAGHMDTIRVLDTTSGEELKTLRWHEREISSIAYSPDGKHIVSGSCDGAINVWDASTGTEIATLLGHEDVVCKVVFCPDSERIISCGSDNTLKIWDAKAVVKTVTLRSPASGLAFSPDSKRIVACGSERLTVWDVARGSELIILGGGFPNFFVKCVSFSPDGKRIVFGGEETIRVSDAANGEELMKLQGHEAMVMAVMFSPDGKRIVSGSWDKTIKIWDAETGKEVATLCEPDGAVLSLVFSPDGRRIVSGSWYGKIKVWNASTGVELLRLAEDDRYMDIRSVAYSPDGRFIVSGGNRGRVKVWDAITGAEVMALPVGRWGVVSVTFSPDGKRIAAGSQLDNTVWVWDANNGSELMTFHVLGDLSSVVYSPDGKTLAVGCDDSITLFESAAPAGGYEPRKSGETARKMVDELYNKHGFYYAVIDTLQADRTLDQPVRKLALQIANSRKWGDAEKLRRESASVVNSPGKDMDAYRLALAKAEKAQILEPNDLLMLYTLGVAQYRVGAYEEALLTLKKADEMRSGAKEGLDAAAVAFAGMALHQLGRDEEAQAVLERLRALCKEERFAEDQEAQAFLTEAEKLIAGRKE